MAIIEGTGQVVVGGAYGRKIPAMATYSFAIHGGVVGDIALTSDVIPAGAVLIESMIDVDTVLTGATATVALKVESAGDVQATAAISGAPWSSTGAKRGTLTATSTPFKTTAARSIVATVATANLTAGVFQIVVWYVMGL